MTAVVWILDCSLMAAQVFRHWHTTFIWIKRVNMLKEPYFWGEKNPEGSCVHLTVEIHVAIAEIYIYSTGQKYGHFFSFFKTAVEIGPVG